MTIQAPAMTSANLGTLYTLLAAALAVAVITFTGIAHLRRLRFRHQIEAIRDDGVDAVLDGRLPRSAPVAEYLAGLDALACSAWRATIVAIAEALPDLLADGDPCELPEAYRDLTADEQYIIGELQSRLRAAVRSYLIWLRVLKPASLRGLCTLHAATGRRP